MTAPIIIKETLQLSSLKVNALLFIPAMENIHPALALFTHGYTASKASILTWGARLAEFGIPSIIFDLPGHYLGNYEEVESFEDFTRHAHHLFHEAFLLLSETLISAKPEFEATFASPSFRLILGGHSLGALLALKSASLIKFKHYHKIFIAVGIGLEEEGRPHALTGPFYQNLMEVRAQLVSEHLAPGNVLTWVQKEKQALKIEHETIHLISGQDDIIAGIKGVERLLIMLQEKHNIVSLSSPAKLSHHLPEMAATHILSFLRPMFEKQTTLDPREDA